MIVTEQNPQERRFTLDVSEAEFRYIMGCVDLADDDDRLAHHGADRTRVNTFELYETLEDALNA